ncbi:MAG: hypothetical protein KA004_19265 [Verrucomicrobiales bacterium]|nr:hypothetical protein [Verrucomicrobiales bacterium]
MAINKPSLLQRDVILESAITAFSAALAPLRALSTLFTPSLINAKTIDVPYWPLQAEASKTFVPGAGYTQTQSLNQYVVTFDTKDVAASGDFKRLYQEISYTSAEWEYLNWDAEKYGALKGYQLASDVIAEILALVVSASFPSYWEGAAAAFNFNILMTELVKKAAENNWPEMPRSLILNPTYYTNLLADPSVANVAATGQSQVFNTGALSNIAGFDLYKPINGIPNNTAGNGGGTKKLSGIAVHPSAIACVVAPLTPAPAVLAALSEFQIVTSADVPDLAFAYRSWANPATDVANEVIECRFAKKAIIPKDKAGNAVGTNPGLIRIVAPS